MVFILGVEKLIIYTNRKALRLVGLLLSVFFALFITLFISSISMASEKNHQGRLITIYDRETEKVFLSKAETVREAIKDAKIDIDKNDAVEPALDEKLIASDYQINIYRARPVIIVDGNTRAKVVTPYQTASQIASSVGIILYDDDIAELKPVQDIVANGAGLEMTIDRAIAFTFTLYGNTAVVRTQANNFGEMLDEKGIKLSKEDLISSDLKTLITQGSAFRVWREGKQTVSVEEEVDFEIEKIEDIDREVSYREIKTPGEKGLRNVTYEIIIQDGKEVSRTEIVSLVTKQPKKQIEVVGAKGQYTTPSENESITWDYLMAQGFSRAQTAGIMGNIMQEHGFQTSGDGLVQWTGGRKSALMSRPNPYNIYTQLDFLMYELNGGYASVRDAIKASTTLEEAVVIFQNRFERCGVCAESARIQFARNILASH